METKNRLNFLLSLIGFFKITASGTGALRQAGMLLVFFFPIFLSAAPASAMLISLEGAAAAAIPLRNPNPVLVSKESQPYPVNFVIRGEQDRAHNIFVAWERAFSGTFVVREESGKPDALDLSILKIICRENIRGVEDYARWLDSHFTYEKHAGADVWGLPQETLNRRKGDCKDLSLLNTAFLRVLGYQPRIFAMARLTDSHAICVFEKEGRYFWFDNTELKETPASTLEEFKTYIYNNNRMYYLYEVNAANLDQANACSGD